MLTKLILPDANLYTSYSMYFAKGNPEYDFLKDFIHAVTGNSHISVMHIDLAKRAVHAVDVAAIPIAIKERLLFSELQFLESDDYTQSPIIVTTANSIHIVRYVDNAASAMLDQRYVIGSLVCYALDMMNALNKNHSAELWQLLGALYGAHLSHEGTFKVCRDTTSDPIVLSSGTTPSGSASCVSLFNLKKKIRLDITRTVLTPSPDHVRRITRKQFRENSN